MRLGDKPNLRIACNHHFEEYDANEFQSFIRCIKCGHKDNINQRWNYLEGGKVYFREGEGE